MKEVIKNLENKGIRATAMRIMIYKNLLETDKALSLGELEKGFETSERSTLYRTIKTFEDKGVVHQIEDGTGVIKYALWEPNSEGAMRRDLHLHFHCTNCKETVCLTEHKIPQINLPKGFSAEDINLVVKGICDKC